MPDEPLEPVVAEPTEPEPAEPEPAEPEFDRDRAMALIEKLRAAEKQGKADARALKDAKDKLAEYEAAQLTEQERKDKELADLQGQQFERERAVQEARLEAAFYKHAAKPDYAVADPDVAYAMLDRDQVEYDDNGAPSNLADLIPALLEAHPILKATGGRTITPPPAGINAGAGHGTQSGPALTADELEAAREMGMSPERYAALKGKTVVSEALQAATSTT